MKFILYYLLYGWLFRSLLDSVFLNWCLVIQLEDLNLLKEKWLTETSDLNVLEYVSDFKEKLNTIVHKHRKILNIRN